MSELEQLEEISTLNIISKGVSNTVYLYNGKQLLLPNWYMDLVKDRIKELKEAQDEKGD